MHSPSKQIINSIPIVQANPAPEMPTIEFRKEEQSTYRMSNTTNICNVEQLILQAIYEGSIEQLKSLKVHLRDLNYLEEFNEDLFDKYISPLILAVGTGQLEIVRLLLQNDSIDVNLQTKPQQLTALKLACNNGYYEIAELLVNQGADVNSMSEAGSMPLFYCFNRLEEETNYFENKQLCFKLGELLIDNGADINAIVRPEKGYSLLLLFCSVKDKLNARDLKVNLDVIRFLVSHGANKEQVCKKNKTALQLCKKHIARDQVTKILTETKQTSTKAYQYRPQLIQHQVVRVEGAKSTSCCSLLSSSRRAPEKSWWQLF